MFPDGPPLHFLQRFFVGGNAQIQEIKVPILPHHYTVGVHILIKFLFPAPVDFLQLPGKKTDHTDKLLLFHHTVVFQPPHQRRSPDTAGTDIAHLVMLNKTQHVIFALFRHRHHLTFSLLKFF